MDVSGKKAVVFGGTSGIGKATVERLAAAGAGVVAISRDPSKAGRMPAGVTLEACDVRDRAAMQALFAKLAPFDILISAATGGDRAVGPFMDMDMDGYQASFDKLWGYANVVRYGASHLPESGCVVLVSGTPARKMKPGQIAIGSVGGAVEALVKGLAPELAPRRINVVAPGQVDTPMVALQGEARKELYAKMTAGHLIQRPGVPDEVAQAIMLCVENDFMTGCTIDVDGGWLLGKG
ncbi:MAG: SDR family oxidoreductase [Pseudomonadota bacterium]